MTFSTPGFLAPLGFLTLFVLWTFPPGAAAETPREAPSPDRKSVV